MPSVPAPLTIDAYRANRDPAVEAIQQFAQPIEKKKSAIIHFQVEFNLLARLDLIEVGDENGKQRPRRLHE